MLLIIIILSDVIFLDSFYSKLKYIKNNWNYLFLYCFSNHLVESCDCDAVILIELPLPSLMKYLRERSG